MLTDIFAYRYLDFPIWSEFTQTEACLLNQLMGVAKEAIPTFVENEKSKANIKKWKNIHDTLSRELGVDELHSRYYSIKNNYLGQTFNSS